MSRLIRSIPLLGVALGLGVWGQTDFSLQPRTPAQQRNNWKLPKVTLFELPKTAQVRSATLRLQPNAATRACGHIIVMKPDPAFDSRMVIQPPKQTSSMPMLEGLPACSEMK